MLRKLMFRLSMGWTVTKSPYGVKIEHEGQAIILTSWPVDPFGRVSDATRRDPTLTG